MKSYIYKEIDKKDIKKGIYVDILIRDEEIKRGKLISLISKTKPKDGLYKVKISTGDEGKLINIVTKSELETDNFKFFNRLFFEKEIFALYNISSNSFFISKKIVGGKEKSFILLFTSKTIAERAIQSKGSTCSDIKIRSINRNRRIHQVFSKLDIDYFVINLDRIVQKDKFIELENKIRSN